MEYKQTILEKILRKEIEPIGLTLAQEIEGFDVFSIREIIRPMENLQKNVMPIGHVIGYKTNWAKAKSGLYALEYSILGRDAKRDGDEYLMDVDKKINNASTIREIILNEILSSQDNYSECIMIKKDDGIKKLGFAIFYEDGKAYQLGKDDDLPIKEFFDLKKTVISPNNLVKRVIDYMAKIGVKK
jgi:hypothetical protein